MRSGEKTVRMTAPKPSPSEVPQLYRPSNGTEGIYFQERWCDHCKADKAFRDSGYEDGDGCPILAATMGYDITHPKYPREWQWQKGEPICTAFDDEDLKITNAEREAQIPLL